VKRPEEQALHNDGEVVSVYRAQGALKMVERFVNRLDDICREVREVRENGGKE
jgi:hypothetical protein